MSRGVVEVIPSMTQLSEVYSKRTDMKCCGYHLIRPHLHQDVSVQEKEEELTDDVEEMEQEADAVSKMEDYEDEDEDLGGDDMIGPTSKLL